MSIYSRDYCIEKIKECDKAESALLNGKSYRIGTRELTRANLDEIKEIRARWEKELYLIENGKARRRARRVVPRDL